VHETLKYFLNIFTNLFNILFSLHCCYLDSLYSTYYTWVAKL